MDQSVPPTRRLRCICIKNICFNNFLKVETPWKRKVNEFALSSYGPSEINFSARNVNLPPSFLGDVLSSHAQRDRSGFKSFSDQGEPKIGYKFLFCEDGFGYFYFENASVDTTMTANLVLQSWRGCALCKTTQS